MFIQIYSYIIAELKSNNENMLANMKTTILAMDVKLLKKSKCFSFMLH
jgi:hypothetical protein